MISRTRSTFIFAVLTCIVTFTTAGYADELYAWGNTQARVVSQLPGGDDFVKVSVQGGSTYGWGLALRSNGTIVAWGEEYRGRIAETPTSGGFVDVGASEWGGAGLRSDGTIVVWGDTDPPMIAPPAGNDFIAISAGRLHMLALRSDGTIAAWGFLLKGNITDAPTDGGYVAIATGRDSSLALRSDGTVIGWGLGNAKLGTPFSDPEIVSLALGFYIGVGIKSDGTLRAWGVDTELLTELPAGNDFVSVDIGVNTAIGLRSNGTLISWGYESPISAVPVGNRFTAISVDYEEDAFAVALVDNSIRMKIQYVSEQVDQLTALGALLPADGHSLRAKLNAAIEALPEDPTGAAGSLKAFINQVKALVRTGRLTAAQGQQLIDAAQAIIDELYS